MPNMQIKDFNTLVREQVTAIQGGAGKALADFSVGSILRAIVEAYSAVALWIQGLVLQLLATTRAGTSSGADLDSWVADYGLTRLSPVNATGLVTFARFTAGQQAVVPVGAIVQTQTADAQKYTVVTDAGNPAYSATQGGYVLPAGVAWIAVPVQALTPGAAANAEPGAITALGTAISGVDTVTNGAALTNGADAETDTALRARFVAYIASLAKATKQAVGFAITSIKPGLSYTLVENENYDGSPDPGYFYIVVDDGTGYPSRDLLATIYNAVDAVRPVTVAFGVFAPVVAPANVGMTITTAAGYDHAATAALVQTALTDYVDTLPLGATLAWSRLAQVAYDASPGVVNVSAVTVNGAAADVGVTPKQVIKTATVTVA